MEDLSIIIRAVIDSTSKQQQESLQKQLNDLSKNLKLNISIDGKSVEGLTHSFHNLGEEVTKAQSKIKKFYVDSNLSSQGYKDLQARVNEIKTSADEFAKVTVQTYKNTNNIKSAVIEYRNEMGQLVKEQLKWTQFYDKQNNVTKKVFQPVGYTFIDDIAKSADETEKKLIKLNDLRNKLTVGKVGITDTTSFNYLLQQYDRLITIVKTAQNEERGLNAQENKWYNDGIKLIDNRIFKIKELQKVESEVAKTSDINKINQGQINRLNSNISELNYGLKGVKSAENISLIRTEYEKLIQFVQKLKEENRLMDEQEQQWYTNELNRIKSLVREKKSLESRSPLDGTYTKEDFNLDKQKIARSVQTSHSQYGRLYDTNAANDLLAQLNALDHAAPNARQRIKEINEGLSQLKANASSAAHTLSNELLHNLEKMATWSIAGGAYFGALKSFDNFVENAKDISASFTKLKQVLELSDQIKSVQDLNASMSQLQDVAGKQAVMYGQDMATVLDVMAQAGRRFKDVPSIIVATDNALQAMVADNVDSMTAIKGEEALMAQFGLSLGETKDAWAKLTVASHVFLTDTTGIIDALERSGSSFHGMKMNTDAAIASIVALAQESGRTGSVVGNTFKSLIASFQTEKGQKALEQLGIDIQDKVTGKLKDGLTVLSELQSKWPQLSEASRASFAQILSGGKYQLNQLLTFLNDTSGTYQKALDEMKKANQEIQQELVKSAMESLPTQMKMTSAQFQVMGNSFNNVLIPAMIAFFANVRTGTKFISDHAESIEKLIGIGLKLIEAYGLWRIAVALYTTSTGSAIVQTTLMQVSLLKLEYQSGGFVGAMGAIKGAMMGVASTAATVVGRLAVLTMAVETINKAVERFSDPLVAKERDIQSQINALEQQRNASFSGGIWNAAKQGLNFFNPWADSFGDPVRSFGDVSKLANTSPEAIDSEIEKLKSQLNEVSEEKKKNQEKDFNDYQKMIQEELKKADQLHSSTRQLENGMENIAASAFGKATPAIDALDQAIRKLNSALDDQRDKLAEYPKWSQEYRDGLKEERKLIDEKITALEAQKKAMETSGVAVKGNKEVKFGNSSSSEVNFGKYDSQIKEGLTNYPKLDPKLVYALLKQESDLGNDSSVGEDIFQASEGVGRPLNSLNLNESIQYGLKELSDRIKDANGDIKLALQSYNFGKGFIDYANTNGGYSKENAIDFSRMQAQKRGWNSYGDISYVDHVLKNYPGNAGNIKIGKDAVSADEAQQKMEQNVKELRDALKQRMQNNFDEIDSIISKFDHSNQQIDKDIEHSKNLLSQYNTSSQEYRGELEKQTVLLNQKQINVRDEQESIRATLEANQQADDQHKLSATQIAELNDKLKELDNTWLTYAHDIDQLKLDRINAVLESQKSQIDTLDKQIELSKSHQQILREGSAEYIKETTDQMSLIIQKIQLEKQYEQTIRNTLATENLTAKERLDFENKLRDAQKTEYDYEKAFYDYKKQTADDIIKLYKDMYEAQKKAATDAIDAQITAEEKRHQQVTDNLDAEKKSYDDAYNAKIKSLDEQKSTEDYNSQLSKEQEKLQKIQNEINAYSIDNSQEANSKLVDLKQKLADQEEAIAKMKKDREITITKQGLQDAKDMYDNQIDAQKKSEDTMYQNTKNSLDQQKKDKEKYYDDLINDEQHFTDLRNQIMTGQLDKLKGEFGTFKTYMQGHMQAIGQSISINFIAKMQQALDLLNQMPSAPDFNNMPTNSNGNGNNSDSSSSSSSKWVNQMSYLQSLGDNAWAKDQLSKLTELGQNQYDYLMGKISGGDGDSEWAKSQLQGAGIAFDTGGYTGSWSGGNGKLAWLHQKEIVLNSVDSSNILKAVDLVRQFTSNIKLLDFSNLKFTPQVATSTPMYNINMTMHVNGDKDGGQTVFNTFMTELKKLGKF